MKNFILFYLVHIFLISLGCSSIDNTNTQNKETGSTNNDEAYESDMSTETDSFTGTNGDTGTNNDADTGEGCDTYNGVDTTEDSEASTESGTDTNADGDVDTDTDADTDADIDTDTETDTDTDTDTASDSESESDMEICAEFDFPVQQVPSKVMILEDRSNSMIQYATGESTIRKWEAATNAIDRMVSEYQNSIMFGIDLFSADGTTNSCTVADNVLLDVSLQNADIINDTMLATIPGGATPLLLALNNFLLAGYAPMFETPHGDRYLLIISDGSDTCGLNGIFDLEATAPLRELSDTTRDIRQYTGVNTIVIGFGSLINEEELNAIAAEGGTKYEQYILATDEDELDGILQEIASEVAVSCTFEIDNSADEALDLDLVNIFFDATPVPRDDSCTAATGWTWTDSSRSEIRFCKDACSKLVSGLVHVVRGEIACKPQDVIIIV